MSQSAKAQHQVDKANFEAVRAEAKAAFAGARLSPKRARIWRGRREAQIAAARTASAAERLKAIKRIAETKAQVEQ